MGRRPIDPDDASNLMRSKRLEPLVPYPGANKAWLCRCLECGSEVMPRYGTTVKGHGCRVCAGQVVNPDQASALMRDRGLEPLGPFPGSTKPWLCRCLRCDEEVTPTYHSVKSIGSSGCKHCGNRRRATARRLDADKAAAFMREHGYDPLAPYPGSGTPWPCRCLACGHESTPTYDNVKQGFGCGECGRRRTAASHRLDPEETAAVMRAAGLKPLVDYPGAGEPWLCRCTTCQHAVSPTYQSVQAGGGCRYCSGHTVDPIDAATLMREHGLEPLVDYPGASEPWLCRCTTCGEEPSPRYSHVRATGFGCPRCTRRRAAASRRINADTAAALMREHGLEPLVQYPGSGEPWLCRCMTCQRECTPTYSTVRAGGGCRYCGYERIAQARRLDPDAAAKFMREHGLEPLVDYPGADYPWLCECSTCGHTVSPKYNSLKQGQGACRYCCGRTVDPDYAAALMREHGLEPLVDYPGANAPWRCRCRSCQRECTPSYSTVRAGGGCRWCWENRRGNSLRLDPEAAAAVMRAAGLQPLVVYPGAVTPWPCRCEKCGREVSPCYLSVNEGHGCRHCAAEQRAAARRFPHHLAASFMREQGFEPLEPYLNALAKWRCRCLTCDREVEVKYSKVRDGSGCRYCKKPGFNYNAPSVVYIMFHPDADAVKPGIANIGARQDRIATHRREGWVLFKTLPCSTGEEAWLTERATLVRLWTLAGHKRGYLTAEDMPQYGWTETFGRDEIGENLVWSIVIEESARLHGHDNEQDVG